MVHGTSPRGDTSSRYAVYFGAAAALVSGAGLLGIFFGITTLASIYPGYRTIAFSAALFWILLGCLIVLQGISPRTGTFRTGAAALCVLIATLEIPEIFAGLNGGQFIAESVLVRAGDLILMHPTTPISPVASILLTLSALSFLLILVTPTGSSARHAAGLAGLCVALTGSTFALSYVYGIPFPLGTGILPIALVSALVGVFAGLGLAALAGEDALPVAWFTGHSFRARLLRTFIPLTVAVVILQNLILTFLAGYFRIHNALLLAVSLLAFCLVTGIVIAGTARRLGNDLEQAERSLTQSNAELVAAYNQISASNEELRQQYDELAEQGKKLNVSESRNRELADLLDHSSQPFAVGYPDGRLAMYNQAFCDLTGYASDELERIDWSAVLTPPEWREREAAELERLARTGGPVRYEKEYIRKDATRVPVELFVHLIRDPAGRPVKYYSFVTDISERKRAGLLLKKSEEKFRLLADFAYDWEYWISPEGRFIYVSPSCERITRYTAEEFMEDPGLFGRIIHESDMDQAGGHLATITETPTHHAEEFRIRRKDGGVCWIGHTCHAVYDAGGRWIGRRASNRDITRLHEAEEANRKREEDLRAAYEELTASDEELRKNYEELEQSGRKLKESEQRLRRFYESGLFGVIFWNTAGGITDANDKFLDMTGYTREDIAAGRIDWAAMTPPEFSMLDEQSLAELKESGVNREPFEKEYFRKDGTRFPVLVAGAMLDDRFSEGVAFALDISVRKAAETALRTSEERYKSLFENMQEGLAYCRMIYDDGGAPVDFVYLAVNDAFGRIIGEGAVMGRPVTEVFPGIRTAFPQLFEIYGRVARTGRPETFEIYFSPSKKWLHISVYSPKKEEFVAVFSDITARKYAEEALRESGERSRALFDHMIEGLALHELVYDAQGNPAEYRILAVNDAFEKTLGISRSAVLGKLSCEAYGVEVPPFLDRYAKVALTGEADQFETYFEPLKKHFHISVYSPKKGQFATIFENITGRKEEERALRLADRKLQLMNIVAWHDIQNKVTSLRGYIELSRDLVADETAKKMLRSEDEILKVIHQQLGYTREYQEIGAKPSEWVDIHAMLKMVIALKGSRSVKITASVDGLFIYTDPILEKVFSHLIENTLVHAPTATEIRIWYRETADNLVLVYEDNGPGIAEENKKDLFVRTFATTRFGLFFIHDILELSGIGFAETGEPEKGVRFEMTVPAGMYRIAPRPSPGA